MRRDGDEESASERAGHGCNPSDDEGDGCTTAKADGGARPIFLLFVSSLACIVTTVALLNYAGPESDINAWNRGTAPTYSTNFAQKNVTPLCGPREETCYVGNAELVGQRQGGL